jgi:hypothetical protein
MPSVTIPDMQLISHSGAMRSKLTQLQGIPLAQLLAEVAIDVPHPKLLSEIFCCINCHRRLQSGIFMERTF